MLVTSSLMLFMSSFVSAQDIGNNARVYFIGKISIHEHNKSLTENLLEDAFSKVNIFIDTSLVCKLGEQKYSVHNVLMGKHSFSAQAGGKKTRKHTQEIFINVEEGSNYYLQLNGSGRDIFFVKVSEDFGQKIIATLKKDKNCNTE
jgi:hypothetical protein